MNLLTSRLTRFSVKLLSIFTIFSFYSFGQTYNLTTGSSWVVPADVVRIRVECWGAGGGGSFRSTNGGGGGGGGGAYAMEEICVTPGVSYNYSIGAGGLGSTGTNHGGDTCFSSVATVLAQGGRGVANNTQAGAAGGAIASSVGTIRFAGGNGGNGAAGSCFGARGVGGGGGSGAATIANGSNGGNATGGCLWVEGGGGIGLPLAGNGGNGAVNNANGNPGLNYGGGGGGGSGRTSGNRNGGNGAPGIIRITVLNLLSVDAGVSPTLCAGNSASLNGMANATLINSSSTLFSFSGSGQDCANFLIGGTITGLPAGSVITNIIFDATIGTQCTNWYEWDLLVNGAYIGSGCNGTGFFYTGLNGAAANGQTLQLRSWDNDAFCDNITMTVGFTIYYDYTTNPIPTLLWTGGPIVSGSTTLTPLVNPVSNTTYTLTATSGGCSHADVVVVNVDTPSTAPTITPIAGTVCPNTNTTLNAGGGIAGTGSTINWYTGANGTGTFLGSGSSIVVAPTTNTTYYARRQGICNNSSDASVTLNVKNFVYALNGATSNTYCTDNAGWHHFYSGDEIIFSVQGDLTGAPVGYPLATINDNGTFYQETEGPGTAPGCLSNQNPNEERFEMERSWNLDFGGGAQSGAYNIRFYYQPAERTVIENAAIAWMAAYPSCGYGYKYPNPLGFYWFKNSGSNYTAPDYDGTQYAATVSSVSGVNYAQWTGIPNFSGGSGAIILEPITTLPVELKSFAAICNESGEEVTVRWTTASEQNSSHFTVERSVDGINWLVLGTVNAAGTSTSNLNYELIDFDTRGYSVIYYRLNQVDLDGAAKVYGPASAACLNDQLSFEVFPNPAGTEVTVLLLGEHLQGETSIQITDINGKEIKTIFYSEQVGKLISVDLRNLEQGVYIVRLVNGEENNQFVRLIKQ
jgi:hypothetical protein